MSDSTGPMESDIPSCLIAVDIQVGFIGPSTAEIPAQIRAFCEVVPVEHRIFTRFINPGTGGPFVDFLDWHRLQDGNETALAPEVADLPTLLIDKHSYSPFAHPGLEDALRVLDVEEVLVFGIDTDACVLATAFGLFDLGIRPRVVTDLSASSGGRKYHDSAMAILARSIGADGIVNTSDLGAVSAERSTG